MTPLIKICGITRKEDIELCLELGIDCLGFVLVPRSSRYVDLQQLEALTKDIPNEILKVGVFANQDPIFLREAVQAGHLNIVQLHGNEDDRFAAQIDYSDVWKAISVTSKNDVLEYRNFPAKLLVVDSKQGGSGQRCDWNLAAQLAKHRKILIAGGINPDNAVAALHISGAIGVDLSSGVELQPGLKSRSFIQNLIDNLRKYKKEQ